MESSSLFLREMSEEVFSHTLVEAPKPIIAKVVQTPKLSRDSVMIRVGLHTPKACDRRIRTVLAKIANGLRFISDTSGICDVHVEVPVTTHRIALRLLPHRRTEILSPEHTAADIGDDVCIAKGASEPLVRMLDTRSGPSVSFGLLPILI